MRLENKALISKILNNIMAFLKILLCIFLMLVIFTWVVQIAEIESSFPFFDTLNDFFTNFSQLFYTPTHEDDETFNALMYIAISIVFFLLLFEIITDLLADILKAYEKNKEQALHERNERINLQIQKDYKMHLKTAMRFIVMLKLTVANPLNKIQAFKDEKMEQTLKLESQKMVKEVYSMITMSLKCQIKSSANLLLLGIKNAEELNRILFFIRSVCQVEKYVQKGLGYYISVTTYTATESAAKAINDAQTLINLHANKKILCYQIVSECLNLVQTKNFKAISNGEYTNSEDTIYELVNKN